MSERRRTWSAVCAPLEPDALAALCKKALEQSGYKEGAPDKDALYAAIHAHEADGCVLILESHDPITALLKEIHKGAGEAAMVHEITGSARPVPTHGQPGEHGYTFRVLSQSLLQDDDDDLTHAHGDFDETGLHFVWELVGETPGACEWSAWFRAVPTLQPRLLSFVRAIETAGAWKITKEGDRLVLSVNAPSTGKQLLFASDAELQQIRAATKVEPS